MQEINPRIISGTNKIDKTLLPALVLWSVGIIVCIILFVIYGEDYMRGKNFYLIPWILLTTVFIAAPNVYLIYKKQFKLYHPLVFAALTYFLPAFVFGGFLLAAGIFEPYFIYFIKEPEYNFPFTYVVVMLGYGGLTAGFFIPFAKSLGEKIQGVLPEPNWKTESLYLPGLLLLSIGVLTNAFAYIVGVLGFQSAQEIGTYDGLIFLTTLYTQVAGFFLFLLLFKRNKLDVFSVVVSGIILSVLLLKSLYAGNRGSLLSVAVLVTFAYLMAGNKIKFKQGVIISGLFFLAIFLGMIYGTTFRNVKQTESQIGIDQYTDLIFQTFETIGRKDNFAVISGGFDSLGERIVETGSSLAVVVSSYEDLKPYEEGYGLDNNIWKDLVTTFIPRVIWEDKPVASDPRRYSELYFDYGHSSFAITPMGDLIRNFGLIGVPLGMLLLGFILRFFYEALVINQAISPWRRTLYYIFLTTVSYEGFYGTILPFLIKFGLFTIMGFLLINLFAQRNRSSQLTH